MDGKLQGKVAVITGASKGIGKGIALRYAAEGAIVILASRSLDLLSEVVKSIKDAGGKASAMYLDVRSRKSNQEVVDATVAEYGKLDIMVNNAGISMAVPSQSLSPEDWTRAIETNLSGLFYGCQAAGNQMISQGCGSIINITSMSGSVAAPMRAAYCSSKAGGDMLTKVLAVEWADKNVRVNAIAPGYIKTELVEHLSERGTISVDALQKRTPLGRIGSVEDIAGLAVYLAGEESAYMTGSIVTIDGGWSAYGYL